MNFIPIKLQQFVRESISPQNLIGKHISPQEFIKWKNFLTQEIRSVNFHFLNASSLSQDVATQLTQIVNLSNVVNSYILKKFKLLRDHPQAKKIKDHYNYTLNLLDELILRSNDLFPGEAGKIKIPQSNLFETISTLKTAYYKLTDFLQVSEIEEELSEIVLSAISKYIQKKNITGADAEYILSLITLLINKFPFDNQQLTGLLITHDFNIHEFYLYCIKSWKNRLGDIAGLHEQREMLLAEKDRLYDLHTEKGLTMPCHKKNLAAELDAFLKEKYDIVSQMVKLRRKLFEDTQKSKTGRRFQINLPVTQFGLFIRMQIERGLLAKENLGELFAFFATHFYTPNALYISADSLLKKSTDVEFSTAQKLKAHLIGMLNWLNSNYNLSNYN